MEKHNDYRLDGDSPQESAIRFLLRHAECQRVLAISAWDDRQPSAVAVSEGDTDNTVQPTASMRSPVTAVAAVPNAVSSESVAANESFLRRFAQAYAAARHPTPSKRILATGSRAAAGPGTRQVSEAEMAAA
jgi:hypothetical protein